MSATTHPSTRTLTILATLSLLFVSATPARILGQVKDSVPHAPRVGDPTARGILGGVTGSAIGIAAGALVGGAAGIATAAPLGMIGGGVLGGALGSTVGASMGARRAVGRARGSVSSITLAAGLLGMVVGHEVGKLASRRGQSVAGYLIGFTLTQGTITGLAASIRER